ncbi:MAG: ABC transporter permease [Clostridia bacterium]|nr:ABC transporter permease [Clostridia bacterium]
MKSYLDLVSISARAHRKQNRMSVLCIALSVFLVTVIFGMADMFIRSQILSTQKEYGYWHLNLRRLTDEQAELIAARTDVQAASRYGTFNYRLDEGYTLGGKDLLFCGADESYFDLIEPGALVEGTFPGGEREALVTVNAQREMNLAVGDEIAVDGPDGETLLLTVTGFIEDAVKTTVEDIYVVFMTVDGFRAVCAGKTDGDDLVCLVRLRDQHHIRRSVEDIKAQFGLEDIQVAENTQLVGLLGQSADSFMGQIYGVAAVLFMLVLLAGILMIAGSMSSSVARRTEFFGMLRCIGATPRQIMRLVRREALVWCRRAIPAGIAVGTVVIWALCAVLRVLSPDYFEEMPALSVSLPSIAAGVVLGLLTVLVAARAPARRASGVSPLAAVSGGASVQPARHAANTAILRVETALGVHHATAGRKGFALLAGSFALSIVLFLSFSVLVDFMNHAITPLRPWTPDLSIFAEDNSPAVSAEMLERIRGNPAVRRAFGRMFAYDVPAEADGQKMTVDLISYEENQLRWAKRYALEGSVEEIGRPMTGLIMADEPGTLRAGSRVRLSIGGQEAEIEIVGALKSYAFDSGPDGSIVVSEETMRMLAGERDYTIVDVQLAAMATAQDVEDIRGLFDPALTFSDKRLSNRSARGAAYSFGLFIYGFLALIAMITLFSVVNSIAMSVAARMRQYGVLRAVGMSDGQLRRMIRAEAVSYAGVGGAAGTALGLALNRLLFERLVSFRWDDAWSLPLWELGVILTVIAFATALAVRGPLRRIRETSIIGTINAQ